MQALAILGIGLATALALVTAVWLVQIKTRNAAWVDVVWTLSIGILAVEFALAGDAAVWLRVLTAALAVAWSLRLAGYLAKRVATHGEDARYTRARESWGQRANTYMLAFFALQAVIATILALPFLVIVTASEPPAVGWVVIGIVIALGSIIGEGIADRQLARFKAKPDNAGHVCARGLWRYSRHPNYFFESLHWVGYVFLGIGAAYGWVTLISPVLMAFLLLKVSGIPTLEGKNANKRIGQAEYERTTSAFIPWPPKR